MQGNESIYEWDAEAYHTASDPQYDIAIDLLETVDLRGDETVVDAGCGSGRVSVDLLARLPHGRLIAVDLSHNMIAHAEKVLVAQPGQHVEVLQADLQTFVSATPVDGIFSSSAMHFVRDHKTMFENMRQSLKPHGFLAVQFGAASMAQKPMIKNMFALLHGAEFGKYNLKLMPEFFGVDADATYANLQSAGFTEIVVEETDVVMDFARDHRMEHMMRGAWTRDVLSALPSDKVRESLVQQITAIMNDDAVMRAPMTFVRCHARAPKPV